MQVLPMTENDIFLYEDGTWCYQHQLSFRGKKSSIPNRRIAERSSEWYGLVMGIPVRKMHAEPTQNSIAS